MSDDRAEKEREGGREGEREGGRERGREGEREGGREGEREYARERIRKDAADAERRARHGRIALAPIKEGPRQQHGHAGSPSPRLGSRAARLGQAFSLQEVLQRLYESFGMIFM